MIGEKSILEQIQWTMGREQLERKILTTRLRISCKGEQRNGGRCVKTMFLR